MEFKRELHSQDFKKAIEIEKSEGEGKVDEEEEKLALKEEGDDKSPVTRSVANSKVEKIDDDKKLKDVDDYPKSDAEDQMVKKVFP